MQILLGGIREMSRFRPLCFIAFINCLILSILYCGENENTSMMNSNCLTRPKIRGIYRNDEFGNTLFTWRQPDGESFIYPNPFRDYAYIKYYLRPIGIDPVPEQVHINAKIWVVRGEGPDEDLEEILFAMGGEYVTAPGTPVKVLLDTTFSTLGIYHIAWDGTDRFGQPAPSGFYRIYLQVDEELRWYDCMLARECEDLPRDLRPSQGCH
jgi:hypothetical protein